jgi:hypothetical protein
MFTRAICRSFIGEGLVYFVFEDEAVMSRSHKHVPEKVMLDGHGFMKGVSLSKQSEQLKIRKSRVFNGKGCTCFRTLLAIQATQLSHLYSPEKWSQNLRKRLLQHIRILEVKGGGRKLE